MSTMNDLVDSTILYLSGFSSQQDAATYLAQGCAEDDLILQVAEANTIGRGIIEIDDEIIQVDGVDRQNNVLRVPPYGRGFRGSTTAAHEGGVRVAATPQFPRHTVRQAISDAIRAVYPDVYAVFDEYIPSKATVINYPLEAKGARNVLNITMETVGPTQEWLPVRRYELKAYGRTLNGEGVYETGARLNIYDQPVPGYDIHVRTAGPPIVPEEGTDDFALTGLPDSAEDLVRLGAAYRLVPNVETPLLSGLTAQADFSANMRPIGAGERLGKYILGLYRERLDEVRHQQQVENPIRAHYER